MPKKKYYQRPDGLYETSRIINGKRVVFRGHTCQEVDRKMIEFREVKEKGKTFYEVAEEWLNNQTDVISANTYVNRLSGFKAATRYFDKTRIKEIRPLDVQRYAVYLSERGYKLRTATSYLTSAKLIFSWAVLHGYIDLSPAREVRVPKGMEQSNRTALTEDQELLVEKCREGDFWLFGLMALYTGCRRGELLALEWKDIDRDNKVIHVNKKISFAGNQILLEHHLKNAVSRDIPLFSILEKELPKNRVGKIFPSENGGYIGCGEYKRRFKHYCEVCGLVDENGVPNVTAHQFRHSYSTICFESGINPKDAAAFLGDTEIIMNKVYTELRGKHKTDSADRVNAYLEMRMAERQESV